MTAKKKASKKVGMKLSYGVNSIVIDKSYAGKTMDELISLFQAPLNLPDMAIASKDGSVMDADAKIKAGDSIEFIKPAGSKGI